MNGGSSYKQAISILTELETENANNERFVDLCVSLRLCDVDPITKKWRLETQEELLRLGGCWDRRKKRWARKRKPRQLCVIRVHRGQEESARELAAWFSRRKVGGHKSGSQWAGWWRYWTLLLVGGRRGGKTHLAVVALVMFAIMEPGCRLFAVSPTLERGDELELALRTLLPRAWYTYRGGGSGKPSQFKLPHGSRVLCLSGHKGGSLKAGRVDLAVYNEGQHLSKQGWLQLRGAIADKGGMVIVCANPPDQPIGRWIEDIYERSLAKPPKAKVKAFQIVASSNPFVEQEALADIEIDADDEVTYRREVLGEFVPIGDVVFHAYSDLENRRDPPKDFLDITARITQQHFNRPAAYIVGMDFQLTPHICAVVLKVFTDPADPAQTPLLWAVDEAVVEKGDENDLLDRLEGMPRWRPGRVLAEFGDSVELDGYRGWIEDGDTKEAPGHCVVVMDASGFTQDAKHEHHKGRTSERYLAARDWKYLERPQSDSLANPDVLERMKTGNALLKSRVGRPRRFFVAEHCIHLRNALRRYELVNGFPKRRSDWAHITDAWTYPAYRLFGRPKVKRPPPAYEGDKRLSRGREMRGVFRP